MMTESVYSMVRLLWMRAISDAAVSVPSAGAAKERLFDVYSGDNAPIELG
jgi:hypothetical protein